VHVPGKINHCSNQSRRSKQTRACRRCLIGDQWDWHRPAVALFPIAGIFEKACVAADVGAAGGWSERFGSEAWSQVAVEEEGAAGRGLEHRRAGKPRFDRGDPLRGPRRALAALGGHARGGPAGAIRQALSGSRFGARRRVERDHAGEQPGGRAPRRGTNSRSPGATPRRRPGAVSFSITLLCQWVDILAQKVPRTAIDDPRNWR